MDFAVPAKHKIKLKESEKRDKYLDLTRELKKLRNIKVPKVTGALGTMVVIGEENGFGGYKFYTRKFPFNLVLMLLGFICFYGISTHLGYLMPNPSYTYILDYMIWFGWVLWHISH